MILDKADLQHRSTKKQKEEVSNTPVNRKVSFLESLISKTEDSNITYVTQGLDSINFHDEQENPQNHPNFIPITSSDKQRLYTPWKQSLIIKLVEKKTLWQPSEKINLIDLSEDFYLIKLTKTGNYEKNTSPRSMFLGTQFISIRNVDTVTELPTEFYDQNILKQIGSQIGTILKIDIVPVNTTRGRYARLYILAPLSKTLPMDVLIGMHLQKIQYEPSTPLCMHCGRLGHLIHSCPYEPSDIPSSSSGTGESKNHQNNFHSQPKDYNGSTTVVYLKKKK
ncbi:hypothetical protein R3W88_004495 [Solanum pinnatisectum]|uniref:CCHC-type domain-containing protein n=1 Tax=Solanum pinnatisectum TaxID=50273 RepID=A0AAV9K9V3_9SOLN|nr:hypothetical protein R3W88_004495 [Solanum pinnatisectum]